MCYLFHLWDHFKPDPQLYSKIWNLGIFEFVIEEVRPIWFEMYCELTEKPVLLFRREKKILRDRRKYKLRQSRSRVCRRRRAAERDDGGCSIRISFDFRSGAVSRRDRFVLLLRFFGIAQCAVILYYLASFFIEMTALYKSFLASHKTCQTISTVQKNSSSL